MEQEQEVDYVKHMIECKCILPQFKNTNPPIFHKFVVFSTLNERGDVNPHLVQCNNCGVVHRVTEVGISKIIKKENSTSLISIDDLKLSLPPKLVGILELYDCPLASWQEASFILRKKLWGRGFVLAKEQDGSTVVGKYIVILGENLFDIKAFSREEGLV